MAGRCQTHYAASKAAIISLTQSAALALAPYRINVNAVCPGIVPTPMWQQIDKDRGKLFGAKPGEAMAAFINTVPLKRAATPRISPAPWPSSARPTPTTSPARR